MGDTDNKQKTKRLTKEELDAKRAPVKKALERFQNMQYDANKEKQKSLDNDQEKNI